MGIRSGFIGITIDWLIWFWIGRWCVEPSQKLLRRDGESGLILLHDGIVCLSGRLIIVIEENGMEVETVRSELFPDWLLISIVHCCSIHPFRFRGSWNHPHRFRSGFQESSELMFLFGAMSCMYYCLIGIDWSSSIINVKIIIRETERKS